MKPIRPLWRKRSKGQRIFFTESILNTKDTLTTEEKPVEKKLNYTTVEGKGH